MLNPISRRELIRRLRILGLSGPFPGGKHEYMRRNQLRIPIPNPHRGDISIDLQKRILRQTGISEVEWESVK